MNDTELLSTEEIQALVETSVSEQDSAYNLDAYAKKYDIASEDRTLASHLGFLGMVNERFVRLFSISLEGLLRYQPKIEADPINVGRFSTHMESLITPISLNVVKVPPLRGSMLIIIDPQLIGHCLDSFFGGAGLHTQASVIKDFTPTEHRVIQMILQRFFEDMKVAWGPIYTVDFEFCDTQVNPKFTNIVEANVLVVISKFNIQIPHGTNVTIEIIYPYAAMKPIRDLLRTQVVGGVDVDVDDEKMWCDYLKLAIAGGEVDLKADLANPQISLLELRQLKVGDVIPIEMPEAVTVTSKGIPLFKGVYGSSNGYAAVKVVMK